MVKGQRRKNGITVARRFGRLHVFGLIVATLVLAISAVSVLSRQTAKVKEVKKIDGGRVMPPSVAPAAKGRNYVTVKVGGQDLQVDGQTGDIQPLTPQEAAKLAEGLAPMLNKSSEGLVKVQHSDGSESMDLEGRFQNVTVARINKDGTLSQSCLDNPRAAGTFFGIDSKLIESASKRTKTRFNSK